MIKANTMMPVSVSRRRFVQGLAVGGVLATFPHIVRAGSAFKDNAFTGYATELSGKVIDLTIGEALVNFTGVVRKATTINGSIPAPTLRLRKDDAVNQLGKGLSSLGAGLRLRYEFSRQFAPYVGVEWQNKYGNTADFARLQDASTAETSWVAGVRFWF